MTLRARTDVHSKLPLSVSPIPAVILQYFDGNWAKVHTGKSIMIRSQAGQSCRPKISPTHYPPPPNFLLNFPNLPSLYDCKVGELGTWGLGGRFKLRVTFLPKSPKAQAAQVDKSLESPTVTFIKMQSIRFWRWVRNMKST